METNSYLPWFKITSLYIQVTLVMNNKTNLVIYTNKRLFYILMLKKDLDLWNGRILLEGIKWEDKDPDKAFLVLFYS